MCAMADDKRQQPLDLEPRHRILRMSGYLAAAAFCAVSVGANLQYGLSLGRNPIDKATYAVSGGRRFKSCRGRQRNQGFRTFPSLVRRALGQTGGNPVHANPRKQLGYTFAAGDWMQPANDAAAVVPAITDALHALLAKRADELAGYTEGSDEEAELAYITDAIEAYEAVRWPGGGADGGKG